MEFCGAPLVSWGHFSEYFWTLSSRAGSGPGARTMTPAPTHESLPAYVPRAGGSARALARGGAPAHPQGNLRLCSHDGGLNRCATSEF